MIKRSTPRILLFTFIAAIISLQLLHAQLNYGLSARDYPESADYINNIVHAHSAVRSLPGGLYDSLKFPLLPDARYARAQRQTFANYYSRSEGFLAGGKSAMLVRPLYQMQAGVDAGAGETIYESALGFQLSFDVKKKIGGELRAATGMASFTDYVDSQIVRTQRIPGWGDFAFADSNGVYSWQHVSGYLSWKPNRIFNLQAGRDKHFWGEGYRSLWLSDVSGPMPYLQQSTKIWKLQYTSLFTALSHPGGPTGRDLRTAYASFHLISFNATRWLNLQVFESVVWQGTDNNRFRGFDVNYLNPVVFYRPVEYSLGSSDNAMLGFGFGLRINQNNRFYGQLILDEFLLREIRAQNGWWGNKQGLQLGYKSFNLFRVVGLTLQGELNMVRPYTYAHGSPQQSYTHAGMPLAHILGANFTEAIGILAFDRSRYYLSGKLMVAKFGQDTAGLNYGGNPLLSYFPRPREYGNFIGQGLATNLIHAEFKAGWKLKLPFPIVVELTAGIRRQTAAGQSFNSAWVLAGLKLTPWRSYRDF